MSDLDIFRTEFVPNIESHARLSFTSWSKSAPADYARWIGYRDALLRGESPAPPAMTTKYGKALVAAGKLVTLEVAPPSAEGLLYPASAHIWGGNPAQAMLTHDIVIASDASQGSPNQARVSNPRLIALMGAALDPWNADWTKRRTFSFTYGAGLATWPGNAELRAYTSADNGCKQTDGLQGFALDKSATASFVRDAAEYAWRLGKGAENGWNGMWSDNLVPGDVIKAGWFYGSSCPIVNAEWDVGFKTVTQGLRDRGVPVVGGNVAHRSSKQDVRAATNAAMHETLEITIQQGASTFATQLAEITAWQKAGPQPRYFVFMHKVAPTDAAGMRFGLALACIAGAAYIPYQSHADLYLPAEMKRSGQRHYLGAPLGDWTRSGNTWTQLFEGGGVSANWDAKTASFS